MRTFSAKKTPFQAFFVLDVFQLEIVGNEKDESEECWTSSWYNDHKDSAANAVDFPSRNLVFSR